MNIFGQGMWQGLDRGMLNRGNVLRAREEQTRRDQLAQIEQEQEARRQAMYERLLQQSKANMMIAANPALAKQLGEYVQNPGPRPGMEQAQKLFELGPSAEMVMKGRDYMPIDQKLALDAYYAKLKAKPEYKQMAGPQGPGLYAIKPGEKPQYVGGLVKKEPLVKVDVGKEGKKLPPWDANTTGQIMKGVYEQANVARNLLPGLEVLKNSDLYTGPGGAFVQTLIQIGASLGIPTNAAEGDVMRAYQNRLALLLRSPKGGEGGMPGAVSDRDIKLLLSSVPGLNNSVEGRKLLAQMLLYGAQYKIDLARAYQEAYRKAVQSGEPFSIYLADIKVPESGLRLMALARQITDKGFANAKPKPAPEENPALGPDIDWVDPTGGGGGQEPVLTREQQAELYSIIKRHQKK